MSGKEASAPNGVQRTKYQRASTQPENPFSRLIPNQQIAIIPSFTLESGDVLHNVPVAYTTRGKLSKKGDNALVICHALSGSADVSDWWGPLLGGAGRAFDERRFYIVCLNSLGSPYGSASPVTNIDGDASKGQYGPHFPLTTIRDDVNIHRLVLDDLGVKQIAAVVGGSMGGMLTLEYAYFGKEYVRTIVPIATSSRHSAWGIGWAEQQRQSIYCDPKYEDGYYTPDDPPISGLSAARMAALLTYRSKDSFESRFGRNTPDPSRRQAINDDLRPSTPSNEHWAVHNDGHRRSRSSRATSVNGDTTPTSPQTNGSNTSTNGSVTQFTDPQFHGTTTFEAPTPPTHVPERKRATTYFSAQSYLRYQGEKFVKRFDANCYIAITRKLDTHDVSRPLDDGRLRVPSTTSKEQFVAAALAQIQQPTLVLGIESDGLFTYAEQEEIAKCVPNARLRTIVSMEGHDAFLLQFQQVNRYILEFFHEVLDGFMELAVSEGENGDEDKEGSVGELVQSSTFGEAEVDDITAW